MINANLRKRVVDFLWAVKETPAGSELSENAVKQAAELYDLVKPGKRGRKVGFRLKKEENVA